MPVIVVDELVFLTADAPKDVKAKVAAALQVLLSQGRAVGFSVVAALRDPRNDVLPFRDPFTYRIALRPAEEVSAIGRRGTAYRLDGDEFLLIWHRQPKWPLRQGGVLLAQTMRPLTLDGPALHPSASLGLALESGQLSPRHRPSGFVRGRSRVHGFVGRFAVIVGII